MGALLEIALPYLLAFMVAVGLALVAHPVSKGVVGWLAEQFVNLPLIGGLSLKMALRLNEWVANQISPHVAATGSRVALWFNGMGQASKYDHDLAYRQSLALANYGYWMASIGAKQTISKANLQAKTAAQKNALTKAPPIPQKRISQKEVDIEFQKLIEGLTPKEKLKIYPKYDWDPGDWRKWLGVLPALGGAIVTGPKPAKTKPVPVKTKTVRPAVPIAPPQPTTLPRTDDSPYPEPGTQVAPGVVSAKDKWARGEIVKLRDYEKETRKHLGPLAFLAIPIAGISTLIGLLDCKNFGRFAKSLCSIPTNLLSDLLALITDFLVLTNICTILPWIEDAANEVLPFITEFTTGAAALACSAGGSTSPTLSVPTLQLPSSTATLPALQLP